MATKLEISAIISAVDRITGPVRKISNTLAGRLGGATSRLGRLAGRSTMALADLTASATRLGIVGAGGAAVGLLVMTRRFAEAADEAIKLSRQIGFSVESLQELQGAAELTGVGEGTLNAGLQQFSITLGQARAGTGRFASLLQRVSPALLRQVKAAKSNEQAFDLLVSAMDRLEDPAKRSALAAAAFGGAGAKMTRLVAGGLPALEAYRKQVRDAGLFTADEATAAEEFNDSMFRVKRTISGLTMAISSGLIPAMTPILHDLTAFLQRNRELVKVKVGEAFTAAAEALRRIDWKAATNAAVDLARGLAELFDRLGGIKGIAVIWGSLLGVKMVASLAAMLPVLQLVAAGVKALWVALLANPVVAVVAAFAAAIALVIANWSDFEDFGQTLWQTLRALWADGTKALSEFWHELSTTGLAVWNDFARAVGGIWDGIVSAFSAAWDKIAAIAERVGGVGRSILNMAKAAGRAVGLDLGSPQGAPLIPPTPAGSGRGLLASVAAAGQDRARVEGGVTVRFENAPAGLRVAQTASSSPSFGVAASVGRRAIVDGIPL